MKGILLSIAAGLFIGLQGVFNARVGEKIGFWEANTFVHATGLAFTLIMLLITGNGGFSKLGEVKKLYMLGGVLGVLIIFSVMKAIIALGSTFTIAILLVAQLITATIIDSFGLFGSQVVKFGVSKFIGIAIMIAGIIIFNIKG
ncbi:MAG TPA: DMT family transporter [Bacillota bacterium]|nr:DMT family transporter [Bacillota bacterium]